ncbi:MAG: NTP transferase domain-containing protein [Paracoccus sp. (in: a-proteobacteria)]|nr:NTP transferase domain-containing protein [Paracoccus sp. (in: a-proteobacteria)]
MKTLGILLAAGASRRFGTEDKLLAPWKGQPLLLAAARALAQAGCDRLAAVVSSELVAKVLPADYLAIRIEPGQEMSVSFQAACRLADAQGADRMLITLGDMPAVRAETLVKLLATTGESRACRLDHTRTPPALLLRRDWRRASTEQGDRGARSVISEMPASALIEISRNEARDIDTKHDLESD